MSRYLLRFVLLLLTAGTVSTPHAASDEALCREVYGWVSTEYYQSVDEQVFMHACPDSLDKVLNKHSKLVWASPQTVRGEIAHVGMEVKLEADRPVVTVIYEGFSAAKANIKIGDVILEIDGVSTLGLPLAEVHNRLRGVVGSTLSLTLQRVDETRTIPSMPRRIVVLPTVESKEIQPGFLSIKIFKFDTTTVQDVVDTLMTRRRAKAQEPLKGLIFDLRGNPGGRLNAALELTAAFLPEDAPLIRVQEKGGKERTILANDHETLNRAQISRLPPDLKSLPLVVLINQTTAAGAEIVAGVWQGYRRAVVIGAPSFGKNTIETLRLLESRSEAYLKLTTSTWVYLDGKSVAGKGVKPDVLLEKSDVGSSTLSDYLKDICVRHDVQCKSLVI